MFTKKNDSSSHTMAPAQGVSSSRSAVRAGPSIICADMMFKGSVISDGAIQIDGRIEGDIAVKDVTVGSSGEIIGEIKAETLRVKGTVKGKIHAGRVELESGASVEGDIIHTALIIQPEARFEGQARRVEDSPRDKTDARDKTNAKAGSTTAIPTPDPVKTNGRVQPVQKTNTKTQDRLHKA